MDATAKIELNPLIFAVAFSSDMPRLPVATSEIFVSLLNL